MSSVPQTKSITSNRVIKANYRLYRHALYITDYRIENSTDRLLTIHIHSTRTWQQVLRGHIPSSRSGNLRLAKRELDIALQGRPLTQ